MKKRGMEKAGPAPIQGTLQTIDIGHERDTERFKHIR
jgi:hypothetical protein